MKLLKPWVKFLDKIPNLITINQILVRLRSLIFQNRHKNIGMTYLIVATYLNHFEGSITKILIFFKHPFVY